MKRTAILAAVVAVMFTTFTSRPNAQSGSGSLKVTSFPSGARVSIDGVDTGKVTPMSVSLSINDHVVIVSLPGSGWSPDERTVSIVSGNNDLSVTLLPVLTTGPQGPKGDTGPQGPKGDTGSPGPAGTLGSYDQLAGLPCTTSMKGSGTVHLMGVFKSPVCAAGFSANGRFVDMGPVIVDTRTNLVWEKKDHSGGLHDVANTYTWCQATGNSVGVCSGNTSSWIADVNAEGLAGFSDWRLPTLDELVGIESDRPGCGSGVSCIDPIFDPTQAWFYWSSLDHLDIQNTIAGVGDFFEGVSGNVASKVAPMTVRAVRNGS